MSPKRKKKAAKTKPKPTVNDAKKAAAVVSQVLVHFGAGCGVPSGQIFATPKDIATFSNLLIKSTIKNYKKIRWEKDAAMRDAVCSIALLHGQLARTAAGPGPLTWKIIEGTLPEAKKKCGGGAGGGLVCVQ